MGATKLQSRELVALPEGLADVLDKMLEPAIAQRFQDANQVLIALRKEENRASSFQPPPGISAAVARAKPKPASQRERLMRQLEWVIDRGPQSPYAQLSLEGDVLTIRIELQSTARVMLMPAFGAAAILLGMIVGPSNALLLSLSSACCVGIPLFLVGMVFFIAHIKSALGINTGIYELKMTGRAVHLNFHRRRLWSDELELTQHDEIPLERIRSCYLHSLDMNRWENQRENIPMKIYFQRQGIYFVDDANREVGIDGSGVLMQDEIFNFGFKQERLEELEWLYQVVCTKLGMMAEIHDARLNIQPSGGAATRGIIVG